jgi:FkbM family methyltransferase
MMNFFEKYLWKFIRKADPAYHASRTSFAQQGEDLVIDFIFTWMLNCPKPSYLDIGVNHPSHLSNTYFFYKKGCTGVNIEPDPDLFEVIKNSRKNDINLQIGIGNEKALLDFYVMGTSTLNTFSKETAYAYSKDERFGKPPIKEVKKIEVLPVNDILLQYFSNQQNYFISIDVEGLDYEILSSIDFEKYRPAVICIETDSFLKRTMLERCTQLLQNVAYTCYGENSINTIFIDKTRFAHLY